METKPIVWKDCKARYSTSTNAYCGSIKIGSAWYDGVTSQKNRYKAYSMLPSIIQPKENFDTVEKAKTWVEGVFAGWVSHITK